MTVGIVGLGLIGGSLAKAYKKSNHTVYAFDTDATILNFAKLSGVVDKTLDEDTLPECDAILIAILPHDAVEYFSAKAPFISKDAIVIDCCGTKRVVCEKCFEIAKKYSLTFVGGHPMAGTHKSGFKNSDESLFVGEPMVLVPERLDDPSIPAKAEKLLKPAGFGHFSVTTAEKHDEMIAFTSQMAHIVSNAFIKSPTAFGHKGFSAGSYKDLTRVAWLNPKMWTELFLENSDNIIKELDILVDSLNEYKSAIMDNNSHRLCELLDEGRKCKQEIDG